MLILVCFFLTFSLDREADIRQCINGNPTLLATPIILVSTSASRLDLSNFAKNYKIWPCFGVPFFGQCTKGNPTLLATPIFGVEKCYHCLFHSIEFNTSLNLDFFLLLIFSVNAFSFSFLVLSNQKRIEKQTQQKCII